jgi:hypothetical protein
MAYIGRSPQLGVRTRYYYTATGGETSLSGPDDNGATLVFSDGTYVDVMLNGVTLVAGTDYNTGTTNTISGLTALTAADVVEIVVYDVFSVGDAVSKSNGGAFEGAVTFNAGLTANTADINGGTVDGATINDSSIGGTTPAAGAFTTLEATSLDSTPIGGTTPAAGAFTTLEATSLDSTPIGGTTPAAGAFTTLSATGNTTLDGTAVVKQGLPIIDEAGTAKTLTLSDNGGYIVTSNGSAVTITVPPNSSVAFPTGAEIVVFQSGAGQVIFAAGAGVTIRSKDSNLKISAQYAAATLKKVATDEWHLLGDLAA